MQSCLERICIGYVDKRGGQQCRKVMHKQEEEVPGDRQLGRSLSIILEIAAWKVIRCQYPLRNGHSLLSVLPSGFN